MCLQEKIKKRQNEREMLEYQFVARYHFNSAECRFNWAFTLSLISLLLIFFSDTGNPIIETLLYVVPSLLDIIACILILATNHAVKNGALLRNYFDAIVLGFKTDDYTESKLRSIRSLTNKITTKHPNECDIQISNTSHDNPPGVKDWYEFSKEYSDSEIVFECQRQNQWWTKEMLRRRLRICIIITIGAIAGLITIFGFSKVGFFKAFVCLAGLVKLVADSLINNYKYIKLSWEIDGSIRTLESSRDSTQIESLQKMICDRREIPVLEISLLHKKNSKVLSEEYEIISK